MIEGNLVYICGLTKDSENKILEWVNKPKLKYLTGTVYPVSEYEHEIWIAGKTCSSTEKLFLIKDKETENGIGTVGIKNIDFINSHAEIYLTIAEDAFVSKKARADGLTYGMDTVSTITEFCFNQMNLHKVYLHVFDSNERAKRCYQKVGYEIEGRLKEHHFSNGCYETVLIMSKIRAEL